MNQDSYTYTDFCPTCNTERSVSASRADIDSSKPVKVYAIAGDHSWTLSDENAAKLREHFTNEVLREALKPRPHGLAVREGFMGTVENAERYRYPVATYDCSCGIGYSILLMKFITTSGGDFRMM